MNKTLKSVLAVLFALLMVAPVVAAAVPVPGHENNGASSAWITKFHPALLSKVLSGEISDDDVITVVFRLEPLPSYTAAIVKGDHQKAVNALKTWASLTQAGFITEVYKLGGEVLNKFWIDNVVLVRAKLSVIKELASYPGVTEVFENFKVHVLEPVNQQALSVRPGQQVESWGIFKIDAPGAWELGYLGEGVRIATLDTGVDVTHPALEGKMLTLDPNSPYYPGGWMEFDENGNPVLSQPHDTHGHGTHVSGTALGGDTSNILIGVAPGATLMHGLVLPGGGGTFAQVLAGIQWAVDPYYIDPNTGEIVPTGLPAHVISMSLGATAYYGDDLFPGIEAALLANIIVVAAIGNDGPGTSSNPGNIWGVFGVGATDQNDEVAYFSSGEVVNWPNPPSEWPFYDTYPSQYIKPDFSAPGVGITSAVPGGGYAAWDGTSMATPHVAGTVALILQASGWAERPVNDVPERVYEILKNASVDLGDPGQDTRYGWGRINASQAVQIAMQYAMKSGVQGKVLDSIDNSPVKWAKITVVETGKTYGVRPDGSFKIPLEPGTYHLNVSAWGYHNKTVEVVVKLLNGTIAGIVYDAVSNTPIQGATVTVLEANVTVVTNETGYFQVSVPAGTYTLVVSAEGYYPYNTTVSVDENETVFIPIPLNPLGWGTIAGYVTDAATGEPIQGALVSVDYSPELSATTDANGYYEIPNVPAGSHVVSVFANGYTKASANVTLAPNETVVVNFSLEPLPPTIAVVGNIYGHIHQVIEENFSNNFVVANYSDAEQLLNDWLNGEIYPVTIIIDHWNAQEDTPPVEVLLGLLELANATGTPLIFLDTPYSGTTAVKALYVYYDEVTSLGYPAPADYEYHYPSAEYVKVVMLDPTHPLFDGVVPDNDSWFYLADLENSDYADYIVFYDWSQPITFVGNISDEYNGIDSGAVGLWTSPGGSLWIILSSWGESYWMNYLVPGSDGKYSNNTLKVLVNAVVYALTYLPDSGSVKPSLLEAYKLLGEHPGFSAEVYTNVTIYLDRLPYGYVEATLKGNDGSILSNATVKVLGTPVETMTDENGYFKIWLPAGNYTIEFYKPGYAKTYVNVTVSVNKTTDLGVVMLERVPRIAILYDYNSELKGLIEEYLGWYAKDFDDPSMFADAINDTFFDAAIWAGHYLAAMPSYYEYMKIMAAVNATGKSIIMMDQWDSPYYPDIFGYGIRAMHIYEGDPSTRYTGDYFGEIYIRINASSPIFKGYQVGQMVKILLANTGGYGTDFAAFNGFSGQVLAGLYLGGVEYVGDAIGVKVLPSGAKIVLMASWAPEEYQDIQWWTDDMVNIFLNAVKWIAAKKVNVTPSTVEAHVGDTIELSISGAPANYTFKVYIDSDLVTNVTTDANGTATLTLKVPVIPGGEHTIYLEGQDESYYGEALLIVKAKVDVSPAELTVPGTLSFNITGLPANATIHLYVDSNYLGTIAANAKGVAVGLVNIPFISTGSHCLKIVDEGYAILAKTKINVTNSLDVVTGSISSLVSQLNASIISIVKDESGKIYALVEQKSNDIMVELSDVKNLVTAKASELESLLKQVNGSLAGLIETKSGDIYALIDTGNGQILAKLTDIQNLVQQGLVKLDNIQNAINTSLSQVSTEATSAKSRATQGLAVGSIALVVSLAGIATMFRRP